MCLPNFIEMKQTERENSIIGYRNWGVNINNPISLLSEYQNYEWNPIEGPHEVRGSNSGIYSYNNYNNNNNNNNNNNYYYYNNNHCNYNNYNNNYNDYYYISGIINQWGKVAIHETGYRSEFATVNALFTIREIDAKGPAKFIFWIKTFNKTIENLAERYNCNTIHYQDYNERNKQK